MQQISSYDSEEGSDDYSTGAGEYDRAKSAAKLNEYDSDDYEKYENSDIWDSDSDSESGNSSDSSASNFVTMKEKKPSVDKRLTDLEEQLSDMQATLKQILSLTKKSISNR